MLMALSLITHEAGQARKDVSPFARTIRECRFPRLQPLIQDCQLAPVMNDQQQQRDIIKYQCRDRAQRDQEYPGYNRNQDKRGQTLPEGLPETGHASYLEE